jgi:uncharacterized repeat protein (TIGR01451 family)
LFVPGASGVAPAAPALTADQALQAALASVDLGVGQVSGEAVSRLVYFPLAPGVLVPAWSQVSFTTAGADWYTLVDALTGDLLWRKNIRSDGATGHTQSGSAARAAAAPASAGYSAAPPAATAPHRGVQASTQDARFSVYVQADGETPADSPAPQSPSNVAPGDGTQFPAIARTDVSMLAAQDITASPDGWIPDGGNTTTGNNVDAYLDANVAGAENNVPDVGTLDNNGRPVGNLDTASRPRDFLGAGYAYTPPPSGGNPNAGDAPTGVQFRRGAVTQLFYVSNWYHDQLYNLGFDEAAGNFQTVNFSGQGAGNDPVLAEVQDGSGTNNANFSTPPDGVASGRMQMYRFTFPNPDRDGDLDTEIVIHELTHGLSNRLVGNGVGLVWDPGGSMGEGWSDFYALSLLNNTNADDPDGNYAAGAYATYQLAGLTDNYLYAIRRFPYSTDNSVNPLTWADVDDTTYDPSGGIAPSTIVGGGGSLEVHNAGEIWSLSLWEVRSRIIADPAGANGDVPTGNQTMLQITTDAMKLTPLSPSFVDARDALIDADCAANNCANERSIWEGFADRGLGYKAVAPLGIAGWFFVGGHLGVGESFEAPYLDVASLALDDSLGNGNGTIDPGEPISLTVSLTNPWRGATQAVPSADAVLSTASPSVTLVTDSATYGAIAPQGSAAGTPFIFTVDPDAVCGQSLTFTITTQSALGSGSAAFTLRLGAESGTAAPVTITRTIPGGLAIPDADFFGVTDSYVITQDLEIADLDFRIDNLSHTFTGDLQVMLKAPNGYGTDMAYQRGGAGGLTPPGGDGNNFVNTVFDDEATADLMVSVPADAPFTGSWLPAFNSPSWSAFGAPIGPDPVGQLSRLDGLSTQGEWNVHVSDVFGADIGTLNAWSLIVTPKAFTCTPFTPAASVAGTKEVAGNFAEGGTITYTIELNNNGSGGQDDNPGDEFTDVLPAELTLVSADASSGTVTANVGANTVTWNGAILPVAGSVTITITATIDAGTDGQQVSNQGTIAYDADLDGTNEASAVTDDPSTSAANDATSFTVGAPALIATLVDRLHVDANSDGKVSPGDTLRYTAIITNSSGTATGVNFSATVDGNTTLVPGSVTTTQGSVLSSGVGVNVGNLNGSVTITYQVLVKSPLPAGVTQVSSQGTISGSNFTTLLTNDPDTAAPNDATVTQVDRGGTSASRTVYLPIIWK